MCVCISHWVSKHLPLTGCGFITHPVGCNVTGFIFVFRFLLLGRKGKLWWCFPWHVWMEASSSQQPQEPQAAANITLKVIHVLPLLSPAAMACGAHHIRAEVWPDASSGHCLVFVMLRPEISQAGGFRQPGWGKGELERRPKPSRWHAGEIRCLLEKNCCLMSRA